MKPPVEAMVVPSPYRTLVHTPKRTAPLAQAQSAVEREMPRSRRRNTTATAMKATEKRRNTISSGESLSMPIFMNSHERPHAIAILISTSSLFL